MEDAVALYVVPTPLGNLADLTRRAEEILRVVPWVAAEDTRHSGPLLKQLGSPARTLPAHRHNEHEAAARILEKLQGGESVALVTDAGTPGISDPGRRLVETCISRGLPVTVLPGPCAATTALVGSGFPCDKFFFGGFLPVKSGRRLKELAAAAARSETSVFYESPHRLEKTLAALVEAAPQARACVPRELTKTFEEYRRGTPAELLAHYQAHPPKGEIH